MSCGTRALLFALVACTPACVTGTWTTWRQYTPADQYERLEIGEADLNTCLSALGAPLIVREHVDGAVLAWGWARERSRGFAVSVPVTDWNSASYSYSSSYLGLQGVVLFFDEHWNLTAMRSGSLTEVLPPAQVRARLVEEDGS